MRSLERLKTVFDELDLEKLDAEISAAGDLLAGCELDSVVNKRVI